MDVVQAEADSQTDERGQTPNEQPAAEVNNNPAAGHTVPKETVDQLVINFICEGLLPFSVVEEKTFKKLVTTLQPQAKVISPSTVTKRIFKAATDMKEKLTAELAKVRFVATTADYWSANQKYYLGVTCHWIEEKSLERRSVALACTRVKGSQTFKEVARALNDVHRQYKIRQKVVRTTTDNETKLIKAFKSYGLRQTAEVVEDEKDPQDPGPDDDQLPPHQKCACHLLNLVDKTDAARDNMDEVYKERFDEAFNKCKKIWNKTGRSHLASEVIEEEYGLKVKNPKETKWNSTYFAFERILRIFNKKGESVFKSVCERLKVEMLTPTDVEFLEEYCETMKPLMKASTKLQSEKRIWLGSLLPLIHKLQSELTGLESTRKHCKPLIKALQGGLEKRFAEMKKDPELIAAAILLPEFRTSWTDDESLINAGLKYVKQQLGESPDILSELHKFLDSKEKDIKDLHSFPAIKKLSLKLNTALPASAACERLLSAASRVFTTRRIQANDENLENQLLLKVNAEFRQ